MSNKGLTLVEIIVSTLIIVAVSAGLSGAFFGGHQLMDRSRHRLQALNFAREALDTLRADYRYDSDEMSEGDHNSVTDPAICAGGNIIRGDMQDLNSASLVYAVTDTPNDYKRVGVTIGWTEIVWTEP